MPVTHLFAALLRTSTQYQIPKSAPLELALAKLRHCIESTEITETSEAEAQATVHSVFKALWQARWRTSAECRMPDPTMCFLMLFCLKTTGEFSAAKEVTGPIAKLCRAIQLSMTTEIHSLVATGQCEYQMEAMDLVAEFVTEKKLTTFNSLMSLQHYATALSYNTMSLPKIWWLDRENWQEMMYQGRKISIDQIGEMFEKMDVRIIDLWENSVMLGLGMHVNYSELADDLTNTKPGYSFLDDPDNPFLALKDDFVVRIFNDPALFERFTIEVGGVRELSVPACRKWLSDFGELEGLLMLEADMEGAGLLRGTELAALLARNSALRIRNLTGLGKFVSIVRQYDKTTNTMQKDRLIPHAVHALGADILIQLHTFARPFARVSVPFALCLICAKQIIQSSQPVWSGLAMMRSSLNMARCSSWTWARSSHRTNSLTL